MSTALTEPDPVQDWPLWWFAGLEAAVKRDDLQAAAEAQRELERLGFSVTIPLRHCPSKPEACHAG